MSRLGNSSELEEIRNAISLIDSKAILRPAPFPVIDLPIAEAVSSAAPADISPAQSSSESEYSVKDAVDSSTPLTMTAEGILVDLRLGDSFQLTTYSDISSPSVVKFSVGELGSGQSAEVDGVNPESLESSDADVSDELASGDFQKNEDDVEDVSSKEDSDTVTARGEKNDRASKAVVGVVVRSSVEASEAVALGDALATQRIISLLNLPEFSGMRAPTPARISDLLRRIRQNVVGGRTREPIVD